MAQSPAITGTEGQRLDVTVTVDSTFGGQQTQTIELRIEDGGAVVHTDTQDVTLADSTDSEQITLSWPTSSGDKGVYDLFTESGQDTIQRLVEVDDREVVDDFEDGDLSEYSGDTGAFGFTSGFEGARALQSPSGGTPPTTGRIESTQGLPAYPTTGDRVTLRLRNGQSGGDNSRPLFKVFDVNTANSILIRSNADNSFSRLTVVEDGTGESDQINTQLPTQEWLKVEMELPPSGGASCTVFRADGSVFNTYSVSISPNISDGGIEFQHSKEGVQLYDIVQREGL